MKIDHDGKEVEAYHLIMRKENALDILNGKKKAEIRTFSDKYVGMFVDSDLQGKGLDFEETLKTTAYARFTNYNGSWHLDVKLSELSLCTLDKVTVEEINNDFDLHDLDNEWEQHDHLPDEEKPLFFLLGISEVISHSGLV